MEFACRFKGIDFNNQNQLNNDYFYRNS
jgi:hypothetical protein